MTVPDGRHDLICFLTETGSRYELDAVCRQIRRLSGRHEPTPRQGKDGTWRRFEHVTTPVVPGETVDTVWRIVDGIAEMTFTSRVVAVGITPGCFAFCSELSGSNGDGAES